ncbi:efflux transporter outer membrane subunit [Zoogloea sp. LCSB751]|uniref:efflux transporter outer membrane subunit n=1 Tax=Zoogloea sp. LCSB751 TaxID=1965277 RepID=UPI0009A4B31F|nr:efflux transporter outer membrane subunit [Zoogloea sp. LCSB751]
MTYSWVVLRFLALPLVTAALAGCADLAPPHQRGPFPVPATYAEVPAAEAESPAMEICWRDYFADGRLRQLLAQALATNRDVKVALLRVEEARATYGIQRADRLPTLAAGVDMARSRVPGDLSVSGQPVVGGQYQVGVGFTSWELDFWGRVRSLEAAALENYLATEAAHRAAVLSLVTQVANGYLGLGELDERLALARRSASSRAETLRIFRRRVELGATSKLELTQVEVLWQQASTLVAQLEQARAAQAQALALLAGQEAGSLRTADRLDGLAVFRELQPGLPSELLTSRPDIVAAEHALKAANANIGAARAAFFPRIALTASAGTASAELDGLFQGGSRAWTVAPSVSLPIFDSGRREAALEVTRLRREQALARYQQTIQAAFRDVSDALSARHWLDEQVHTLRASQTVQSERARLAKLRYDSGAARYLEVLDAERELLVVEQQLVQTRRALLSAQVALYAALGGGSQAGGNAAEGCAE